ncbi:hypothetical protein CDAR_84601 [Caerostris darwini]|uniref:Uncharacterized protein n=1 Tax=Caerostris darwini TaxID=1538125 RepID=A0AAV4RS63_9ARAC|nr:hypothetical protein CDAR_84601 [Caerostris darwini]
MAAFQSKPASGCASTCYNRSELMPLMRVLSTKASSGYQNHLALMNKKALNYSRPISITPSFDTEFIILGGTPFVTMLSGRPVERSL